MLASSINEDNNVTGVIIQHEYGIFGGTEGEMLLTFMERCTKPMLVTLHTILPEPSEKMKEVTQNIISHADKIVVLTKSSKKIIQSIYTVQKEKIFVIPHGIHEIPFSKPNTAKKKLQLNHHTILSTFGLLSRGKGLEYVLRALPEVVKKYPNVLYLILGQTHPVILRQEGELYRNELAELVKELHLEKHVKFYNQYFSLPELFSFLKATDIYISTSTDPNQAVSGTLSYALGTGRAVISTEFAQAKEIVTEKNGRLVQIKNSQALTTAMLDLLSDNNRLLAMHENAYELSRQMTWDTVGKDYVTLLGKMIIPEMKIDHLLRMTDDFGLFQFAKHTSPDRDHGYTIDDNARAMIVCSWLLKIKESDEVRRLLHIYLRFIKTCQSENGMFVNYLDTDKKPTNQNTSEDLEDAQSRTIWALCEVIANNSLSQTIRDEAKSLLLLHIKNKYPLTHLRSKAFTLKGFALILEHLPEHSKYLEEKIKEFADDLIKSLNQYSFKTWRWFESDLNYNNALLPESLLIAGKALNNDDYKESGLASLDFLISKTFSKIYKPIGHSKWYKNNEERSEYDQQPEDPASMITTLYQAYEITHDEKYIKNANLCFSWFLGNNSLRKPVYDSISGGCFDGLHPDRVNLNQGAESLVSYLMSSILITKLNS